MFSVWFSGVVYIFRFYENLDEGVDAVAFNGRLINNDD